MRGRACFAAMVAGGLIIAGCGGGDSPETTAPTPTVTEQADPTDPFPAGEPVDLLVLTDSSGIGLADRYAVLAAEALDREVRVTDLARGGMGIGEILWLVRSNYADEVAEAEIIVVYGMPVYLDFKLPEPNIVDCFEAADAILDPDYSGPPWTPGTKWEPTPVVATVEDWQPLRVVLDQVYDEIWALRAGQPTIIRTYDTPNGYIAPWTELGIESECTANWLTVDRVKREAAEANGAGFVSIVDVFNGPNHHEDPNEKGWMEDAIHANDEGMDIVAQTLAAYGFELSEPPR